jgi:hypothetical protein
MEKLNKYNILINRQYNKVIKFGNSSEIMREYNNILSLPNSDFYYKDVNICELSFNLNDYLDIDEVYSVEQYSKLNNEPIMELHICFVKGKTFQQIYEEYRSKNRDKHLPIIDKSYFFKLLKALLELYFKVKDLNSKLFFHNDLNSCNIIFNDDRFILIDFCDMTTIEPICMESDSDLDAIIEHINSLLSLGKFNINVQQWLNDNNLTFYLNEESIPLIYQLLLT